MGSVGNQKLPELERFLKEHPHITYAVPSSPDYVSLREVFYLDSKANPLIIVRPQTAEDVAFLVNYAKSQDIKFVVRTGGHSLFGHSMVEGAMTIDLRDLAYVQVEQGQKSAKVGGGILQGELVTALHKEGFVTPTGTVPSVGYVGWAAYGGYGPLSAHFGMGVDQIIGAKIVNSTGAIVTANDDLLRGIKGAGGIFGIIVEVTVKVYPMRNILAGTLIFESQDIVATFQKLNKGYREVAAQGLPLELVLQQMVVNSPFGRVLALGFTWSSEDIEAGKAWLTKCEVFGTVIMNAVSVTTLPQLLAGAEAMVPSKVYGHSWTHNLKHLTEEVVDKLASCLETMPSDSGTMFCIHEMRETAAKPTKESVFGTRDAHFMLEILGISVNFDSRGSSMEWGKSMWEAVANTDRQNILPGTYISLDPPGGLSGQIPLWKIYGSHASDVFALKKEYDSENVFDLAIPRLADYLRA